MAIHKIINFIVSCVIAGMSFLLFYTVFYYKKYRLKIETLFAEIYLYQGIVFGFYILKTIFYFVGEETPSHNLNNIKEIIFILQNYLFNLGVFIITLTRLLYNIEMSNIFNKPIHIAKSMLPNGNTKAIHEILSITLSILYVVIEFFINISKSSFKSMYPSELFQHDTPFFISFTLSPLLILINLINIIMLYKRLTFINNFTTKSKTRIVFLIKKDIIIILIELSFIAIQVLVKYISMKLNDVYYVYYIFISYITEFIYIFEYAIELIAFAKSTFCLSMVKETVFGSLAVMFNKEYQKKLKEEVNKALTPEKQNEIIMDSPEMGMKALLDNNEAEIFAMLANKSDEIYIEDYLFDYSEAIITITLSSLLKVYNSSIFSGKKENYFLDLSACSGDIINKKGKIVPILNVSPPNENDVNNIYDFDFVKNEKVNDYKEYSNIFKQIGISNTNFNVKITSFFTEDIVDNITNKNISISTIEQSLFNHIYTNNKDNEVLSLLKINIQDNSFLNSKTFTLKTNDKKYFLEIMYLNTHNKQTSNTLSNKHITSLWKSKVKRYCEYIKKNPSSFLPPLIGVFTIQINNLTPMLIFINKNSLYDSLPKSNLKYWQLIRFDKYKIKRMASSKERNVVIDLNEFCDESNFELVIEEKEKEETLSKKRKKSKKSNTYKNSVIKLKNLNEFSENLKEDLNTMQALNLLNNLSLLMMYYEFEQNKKLDKNEGNAIVNEELINPLSENAAQNNNNQNVNKGNEFDFLNSHESSNLNHFLYHHSQNISYFSEKLIMNGYEGQFEEYKCVCFFMFDNVFLHDYEEKEELGWRISNYYNDVVSYFSNFT